MSSWWPSAAANSGQVAGVGADDDVTAAQGAFDDAGADDVGGAGAPCEGSDGAGLQVIERLNLAAGEDAEQQGLAERTAPALGHHGRRDDGDLAAQEKDRVLGPHAALATFGGDQGAGIIGDPHQAVRRPAPTTASWPGCSWTRSTPSRRRSARSPPGSRSWSPRSRRPGRGPDGTTGPAAGLGECAPALPAIDRLDEITGIGRGAAQAIIAEVELDMTRFPTPGHLVSWAKLSPRTIQSGAKSKAGWTGNGNPYLKAALGEAAATPARTDAFLGERYRRIARRRGKLKALVAVARSILVTIWHLLGNRAARFRDLGSGYYAGRIDKDRKTRNHIRQLEALGYTVTLAPAA